MGKLYLYMLSYGLIVLIRLFCLECDADVCDVTRGRVRREVRHRSRQVRRVVLLHVANNRMHGFEELHRCH